MRIEAHRDLRPVLAADVNRIVIYDTHNNPIGIFIEHAHGVTSFATVEHKDFRTLLQASGITRTVVIQNQKV